jgi:hypothetical protein
MSEIGKSANKGLLPYHVIAAASNGDENALHAVVKHYEGYIFALSTRRLYDEYGNAHLFLDEELRRELETWLTAKILQFDLDWTA